jgi:methyl-accepting chemotaxis protein
MTIEKKLFSILSIKFICTVALGIVAVHYVNALGASLQELGHHYVSAMHLATDLNSIALDMNSESRAILLAGYMKEPDKARGYNQQFLANLEHTRREGEEFVRTAGVPNVRDHVQKSILDKLSTLGEENAVMYEMAMKGDLAGASKLYNDQLGPLMDSMAAAGNELGQESFGVISGKAEEDVSIVGPARTISLVMAITAGALGIVLSFVVRGISRTIRKSVAELSVGTEQVASAASQVASSSQSLAQGASQQAASLEETSASSNEINSMARRNADNSRSTVSLLDRSMEKIKVTNERLDGMMLSINEIAESSSKVSKIIKVIDEIAFQTNILALNAAVEAARAGEAGMGFAVVADEVRSLAQRSAVAAKDTAVLIEESIARAMDGKQRVEQVASAIRDVTEDSGQVKLLVDEVSLGSEEQSRNIDQIGRSIQQMEQVTQTTAANAEESAAAAEELNAQSKAMKEIVGRLHALVESDDSRDLSAGGRKDLSAGQDGVGAAFFSGAYR